MLKYIIAILSMISLSGCSLSPVKTEISNTYVIAPPTVTVMPHGTASKTLLVNMPAAEPAYATTQIAYMEKPYQLQYYTKNRWAAPPAEQLMPLIIQTLQSSGYYRGVVGTPYLGVTDLRLDTHLLYLVQQYQQGHSTLNIGLRAELISSSSNRLLATRTFTVSEPITQTDIYKTVLATNQAVHELLQQLALWVTHK